MSDSKTLAERALRCVNVVKDLPMHERFTVVNLMNNMLSAEAKTMELADLVQKVRMALTAPLTPVADEHYQQ